MAPHSCSDVLNFSEGPEVQNWSEKKCVNFVFNQTPNCVAVKQKVLACIWSEIEILSLFQLFVRMPQHCEAPEMFLRILDVYLTFCQHSVD